MSEASRARGRFPVTARVRGETPVDLSALGEGSVEERILAIEQALRLVAGRDSQEKRLNELSAALNSIAPIATERKVYSAIPASDPLAVTGAGFTDIAVVRVVPKVPARIVALGVGDVKSVIVTGDLRMRIRAEQATLGNTVLVNSTSALLGANYRWQTSILSPGDFIVYPGHEYVIRWQGSVSVASARYDFQASNNSTSLSVRLEPRQKSEI